MLMITTTVIGLIFCTGICWQIAIFKKDRETYKYGNVSEFIKETKRTRVPICIFVTSAAWLAVAIIGELGYALIYVTEERTLPILRWSTALIALKVLFLSGVLVIKAIFGPTITAFSIATCAYQWLIHGKIDGFAVANIALEFCLGYSTFRLELFYSAIVFILVLIGCIWELQD